MSFRKDFIWGAATASYQIEGAWNEDGKSPSIWDDFCEQKGRIDDGSSGKVACDHYHRIKEDVKLMKEVGLKAYRFSISWCRILPEGTGKVNQKGLDFYKTLADELLDNDIIPFATLYHWDLPSVLQQKGGWLNKECADWYAEYVSVVVSALGGKIKNFITFNESEVFAGCGYQQGVHAPGYKVGDKDLLQIGHNILLAHGKAVQIIRKLAPDAKVGFTTATTPQCPVSEKDVEAARKTYFACGKNNFIFAQSYWLDPIVFGKYPQQLLEDYKDIFPKYTEDEMKIISSPIDFIGINTYWGFLVEDNGDGWTKAASRAAGSPRTAFNWPVVPSSLYWGPHFIYEKYKLPVYITENGMSCHDAISLDGKVHDPNRTDYLHRYIRELKKAAEDGADIRGYFQWSFMDNFEWARGYEERFGMIFVDYSNQKRVIKDSANWYKELIKNNGDNL